MKKNYFSKALMACGMAAIAMSASAAEGNYRDVTLQYLKNPAFIEGWQGGLTATADGVGEVFDGAFNLYQVLPDMEAGTYTLKVDAFYRCGNNDFAKTKMANGDNHFAYIYINGEKKAVKGLFDGREAAPNSTSEAATAFGLGEYLNEVTIDFKGGDLTIGIANTGGWQDEWCCFDNFRLFKGSEDLTAKIKNASFETAFDYFKDDHMAGWDITNSKGSNKIADFNAHGGVYRKSNASAYNFGQQVELPAGTYRFSVISFVRMGGAGNLNGKYITCKGAWAISDGESAKDYFDNGTYSEDNTLDNAYLYMSFNETKPTAMDWEDDFGDLVAGKDKRVAIKGLWEVNNGDYANMPENITRADAAGNEIVPSYDDTFRKVNGWHDSGCEREAAAAFIANPEKYRNTLEFTLNAPAKVWIGLSKEENRPAQYWNPFVDFKLEKLPGNSAGVDDVVADNDENAPVEYYNLQGIRVENPANGFYIKKQGNKVTKILVR